MNPPLLPRDARGRARVRGLAQIVACDSHPLIVPRVREYLEHEFKLDEPTRIKWCQHWHTAALTALEAHLKDAATGRYCHGDAITLADVCLEPGRRSKILLGRHRAVFEFHPDR
jgi:maleylacetoacetate isomerase